MLSTALFWPLRVADGHSGCARIHDAHRSQGNPDVVIPSRHFDQRAPVQLFRSGEDFVTVALQADRIGREGAMAVRFTARIDVAWSPSLIANTTQTPRIRGLDPKDGSTTRRLSGRTPWRGQLVARFNADI